MTESRADAIGTLLGGRQLIVVSNREPYEHRHSRRGIMIHRPVGGLAAALDPVMQVAGGTWVAWGSGDADFEVADEHGLVRVPPRAPGYTLRRVPLSDDEVDGFYYGYANQALWPLCHLATQHARFRQQHWEAYQAVNRRFAAATLAEVAGDAIVWVHDYHLTLCPRYLRQGRPDLFVMTFWHIPWPAWDVFRICPERFRALEVLLQRAPVYRERLVFIQKSAPSRSQIKSYRDLQQRVEDAVDRINAAYGTEEWRPITYMPEALPLDAIAALYRMADVCVVSSLADGMNLVAKEFIACQVDHRGVLVLSELAGARDELPWAVSINPYDAEGSARASRPALRRFAGRADVLVAVISGRSLDDIRRRVGVDGFVYAGNHGLEMATHGLVWTLPEAESTREAIAQICRRLRVRLERVTGVLVEDKGLTAIVHYRQTPQPQVEEVRMAVLEEAARIPQLAVRPGRQVLEVWPGVAWDKGRAAGAILERAFGASWSGQVTVVYIGDDRTDEDAFMALREPAVTVKVGSPTYGTAARCAARDVDEVARFLQRLTAWLVPAERE